MMARQKLKTRLWGFATKDKKLEIKRKPFWNLIKGLAKVGAKTTLKGRVSTMADPTGNYRAHRTPVRMCLIPGSASRDPD